MIEDILDNRKLKAVYRNEEIALVRRQYPAQCALLAVDVYACVKTCVRVCLRVCVCVYVCVHVFCVRVCVHLCCG